MFGARIHPSTLVVQEDKDAAAADGKGGEPEEGAVKLQLMISPLAFVIYEGHIKSTMQLSPHPAGGC